MTGTDHCTWLDGSVTCSCGRWCSNSEDALSHALPYAATALVTARRADPATTPEQLASSEALASRVGEPDDS